jgi:hypothetical protein
MSIEARDPQKVRVPQMIRGRHRSSEPRWPWLALDDASRDLLEALPGRCFGYGHNDGIIG